MFRNCGGLRRAYRVGTMVMDHAKRDAAFAAELEALLNHALTDPEERALFPQLANRTPDARRPAQKILPGEEDES
jgi:hypothetical protein